MMFLSSFREKRTIPWVCHWIHSQDCAL
jgi:hypothetical protein